MTGIPFPPFRFPTILPFSSVPSLWKPLHIRIVPLSASLWVLLDQSDSVVTVIFFYLSIHAPLLPTSDLSLPTLPCISINCSKLSSSVLQIAHSQLLKPFSPVLPMLPHLNFDHYFFNSPLASPFSQCFAPSMPFYFFITYGVCKKRKYCFISLYNWLNVDLSVLIQSTYMSFAPSLFLSIL